MSDWDDPDGLEPQQREGYVDAMYERADNDRKRMKEEGTSEHPCPKGDGCALNDGAQTCKHCGRNWPPDETWTA